MPPTKIAVLGAGMMGILLGVLLLTLLLSSPKPLPIINVTHDEYEAALQRWERHNVTLYEVTTREVITNSDCTVIAREGQMGSSITGIEECRGRNRYPTIKLLFAAVDERLKASQNPGREDEATIWTVQFHREMGYPQSIYVQPHPLSGGASIAMTTTVEHVNIMTTATPTVP